jgi:hypothetical protein
LAALMLTPTPYLTRPTGSVGARRQFGVTALGVVELWSPLKMDYR